MDDQIALLKHKLYLIQQGMAFNGKRTKTARSQGKKFQVSVEQEATRLLVNQSLPFDSFTLLLQLPIMCTHLKELRIVKLKEQIYVVGEFGVGNDAAEQLH